MELEPVYRRYVSGDEEELVGLLEVIFKGWPHFDLTHSNVEYWKWKYRDNPIGKRIVDVVLINDKIVGCNHAFFLSIKVGNRFFNSIQSADLGIHSDFRGQGLFSKMSDHRKMQLNENDVKFTYYLSGNPIIIGRSKREGHPIFPVEIAQLVRIRDVDLHFDHFPTERPFLTKLGFRGLETLGRLRLPRRGGDLKGGFLVREISEFDDRVEKFCDGIKEKYSFIVERSKDYLNWRYCDDRGGSYLVLLAEEGKDIVGYGVLRINRYNQEYFEGYIVDILTEGHRLDVAGALLAEMVQRCDEEDVNIIHYWLPKKHPFEDVANRHGFIDSRRELGVFYNPVDISSDLEIFMNSTPLDFHFVYGDTDWI